MSVIGEFFFGLNARLPFRFSIHYIDYIFYYKPNIFDEFNIIIKFLFYKVLFRYFKTRMSIGLRVVRGPDWKQGEKDGGEGHLGTVVCVKENNSVDVVWDNGNLTTCNIGKDGRRELRVVDNAPAGNKI